MSKLSQTNHTFFLLPSLLFVFFLLTATFAQAQDNAPIARYDGNGQMTSINFGADYEVCSEYIYKGSILSVEYDYVNKQEIQSFTLLEGKRTKHKIYLIDWYSHLEKADAKKLPTLIAKGKRVRVIAFSCDVDASMLEADTIEVF